MISVFDRDWETSAAIAEIVIDENTDGKGKKARDIKKTRFKLHNKISALDSLAKLLGLNAESGLPTPSPSTVNVNLGTNIERVELNTDVIEGALAALQQAGVNIIEGEATVE